MSQNIFEEQIHDSVFRGASAVADPIRRKHRGQASQQNQRRLPFGGCHQTRLLAGAQSLYSYGFSFTARNNALVSGRLTVDIQQEMPAFG